MNVLKGLFDTNNSWINEFKNSNHYIQVLNKMKHLKNLSFPNLNTLKNEIKERMNKMKFFFTQQFYFLTKLFAGTALIFIFFQWFRTALKKASPS